MTAAMTSVRLAAVRKYARRVVRGSSRMRVNPGPAPSVITVTASAAWKGLETDEETVTGRGSAGLGRPRLHPGRAGITPQAGAGPRRLCPLVPGRAGPQPAGFAAPLRRGRECRGRGSSQPSRPAAVGSPGADRVTIRAVPDNGMALIFALKSGT